jgi:hypothetical protein
MTEELLQMLHLDPKKILGWTINFGPKPTITVRYLQTVNVERMRMPTGYCETRCIDDDMIIVSRTIEVSRTFDIPKGCKLPSREEQIER